MEYWERTLVLTPWMHPHAIVPWHESVSGVFSKKHVMLEAYDATCSSPSTTVPIPAVVMIRKPISRMKSAVRFSRPNVYERDGYRCQYCGAKPGVAELTYDHVIPKARGGRRDWLNIVTACKPCNERKDCRTPQQAGMTLRRAPSVPGHLPLVSMVVLPREIPDLWHPYLAGFDDARVRRASA